MKKYGILLACMMSMVVCATQNHEVEQLKREISVVAAELAQVCNDTLGKWARVSIHDALFMWKELVVRATQLEEELKKEGKDLQIDDERIVPFAENFKQATVLLSMEVLGDLMEGDTFVAFSARVSAPAKKFFQLASKINEREKYSRDEQIELLLSFVNSALENLQGYNADC